MSEFKDIFDGDVITMWRDEEGFYYISFGFVTVTLDEEQFQEFKHDMTHFVAEASVDEIVDESVN